MSLSCYNKSIVEEKHPGLFIKEQKVVCKLRDEDKRFIKSVIMPTDMYPLANNDIHVFSDENLEEITDKEVLDVIDQVPYKIGHCYTNSQNIVDALAKVGVEACIYCGWAFVSLSELPFFHCWVMLDDTHLIDLANDYIRKLNYVYDVYGDESKHFTRDRWRYAFVEATKFLSSLPNSERCCIGMADNKIYVGCPVKNANEARRLYNYLIGKFPNHESIEDVNKNTQRTPLQEMYANEGLM